MTAEPITTPIIASPADWDSFWRKLLVEYDAIGIAQAQQDPGTVTCWGCLHLVPFDDTIDGFCADCLMRE